MQFILVKNSWRGKKLNKFCPPNQQRRHLPFLLYFWQYTVLGRNTVCKSGIWWNHNSAEQLVKIQTLETDLQTAKVFFKGEKNTFITYGTFLLLNMFNKKKYYIGKIKAMLKIVIFIFTDKKFNFFIFFS